MAKHRNSIKKKKIEKTLNSYTLDSSNETIQPGDCVKMQPPNPSSPSYIARVISIQSNHPKTVNVHVQWYYRPEDTKLGRKRYNGIKEVYLSNHFDVQNVNTIQGKCVVHTIEYYSTLDRIQRLYRNDYFCRFDYSWETGEISNDNNSSVPLYCKCNMPYNPDVLMIQCDGCGNRFHLACIQMTTEEADQMGDFFCRDCLAKENRISKKSYAI